MSASLMLAEPHLNPDDEFVGLICRNGRTQFLLGRSSIERREWRVIGGSYEWVPWAQLLRKLGISDDEEVTMSPFKNLNP